MFVCSSYFVYEFVVFVGDVGFDYFGVVDYGV